MRSGLNRKIVKIAEMNEKTAYHEAGHALIAYYCGGENLQLKKLSIIPGPGRNGAVSISIFLFIRPIGHLAVCNFQR